MRNPYQILGCFVLLVCLWACGSAIESTSEMSAGTSEYSDESPFVVSNAVGIASPLADHRQDLLRIVDAPSLANESLAQIFGFSSGQYLAAGAPSDVTNQISWSTPSANYNINSNVLSAFIGATKTTSGGYFNCVLSYPKIIPATVVPSIPGTTISYGYVGQDFTNEQTATYSDPTGAPFTFSIKMTCENSGTVPTVEVNRLRFNTTQNPQSSPHNPFREPVVLTNGRTGYPETMTAHGFGLDRIDGVKVGGIAGSLTPGGIHTSDTLDFQFTNGGGSGPIAIDFYQGTTLRVTKYAYFSQFPFVGTRQAPDCPGDCDQLNHWLLLYKSSSFNVSNCLKSTAVNYFGDYKKIGSTDTSALINYINQSENSVNNAPNDFTFVSFVDDNGNNKLDGTERVCIKYNVPQVANDTAYTGCGNSDYVLYNTLCPSGPFVGVTRTNGGVIFSTLASGQPSLPFP